jgi:hypothetical protein
MAEHKSPDNSPHASPIRAPASVADARGKKRHHEEDPDATETETDTDTDNKNPPTTVDQKDVKTGSDSDVAETTLERILAEKQERKLPREVASAAAAAAASASASASATHDAMVDRQRQLMSKIGCPGAPSFFMEVEDIIGEMVKRLQKVRSVKESKDGSTLIVITRDFSKLISLWEMVITGYSDTHTNHVELSKRALMEVINKLREDGNNQNGLPSAKVFLEACRAVGLNIILPPEEEENSTENVDPDLETDTECCLRFRNWQKCSEEDCTRPLKRRKTVKELSDGTVYDPDFVIDSDDLTSEEEVNNPEFNDSDGDSEPDTDVEMENVEETAKALKRRVALRAQIRLARLYGPTKAAQDDDLFITGDL